MKKAFFIIIVFWVLPLMSLASFDTDLYFGLKNDDVVTLQKFLQSQHIYNGPANGNFFSITREAVVRFQQREDIKPSSGYFGSRTRARANLLLTKVGNVGTNSSVKISELIAQIQELQAQLRVLQTKQVQENNATSTAPVVTITPIPPPTPVPSAPATTTPVSIIPNAVIFSGESTTTFPATTVTPLKIGDIVIRNGTNQSLLFSQLVLDIQDGMNSPLNRGRSINLIIRNNRKSVV